MRGFKQALILLWFLADLAIASPASPVSGAEFKTLGTPQPVQVQGKKVEVIEFFMYHCPACYVLEPQMLEWVKKQGNNIVFRRIHLPHNGARDAEAHLFLTLEAMNLEESMHARILQAWHVEHKRLLTDDDNIEWAVKNGIDKARFVDAYNSFSVVTKLQGLLRVAESYLVNSTPTLVIDGRYLTGPGFIQDSNRNIPDDGLDQAMLQVADVLVAKALASK
ncbi:thiol:disulfide interchange protein DsbA [Oxalobacteraceae bacterium GrIS 2.11]